MTVPNTGAITGPIVIISSFPEVMKTWLPTFRSTSSRSAYLHTTVPKDQIPLVQAAITMGKPPPDAFSTYPNLRVIISVAAGVEKLLAATDLPAQVPILRLDDTGKAQSMAETVLAHVLTLHKGIYRYQREQKEQVWKPRREPPHTAGDRTVGVLGYGELGRPAVDALVGVGFKVAVWRRSGVDSEEEGKGSIFTGDEGLVKVLKRSSIIVNLLPLTPSTTQILNKTTLSHLPPNASIINLARGGHVNDDDLLSLLDEGRIDTAVLDVFNVEPLPAGHPYWTHPRVVVTPHVACYSQPSNAGRNVDRLLDAFGRGEVVTRVVDRVEGY
ncbi:hypothetical protein HDV00_011091 [Rhizophlyctis rosea]|nr:hypothetical protein HDV00_011091 [Rhizophlyctis rosea]